MIIRGETVGCVASCGVLFASHRLTYSKVTTFSRITFARRFAQSPAGLMHVCVVIYACMCAFYNYLHLRVFLFSIQYVWSQSFFFLFKKVCIYSI